MGEAIVVTSGKGGAGKTTLSANLGCALALAGYSVLMTDTDIGLRNLDILLGLEDRIVYDIVDVCQGVCDIDKAILKDKRCENLYFIPASQAKDKKAINPLQMKSLVTKAKEKYDYIIIDSPAGLETGFENAVAGADSAIVVTLPEMASVRDADRIMGLLEKKGIEKVNVVINRVNPRAVDKGYMLSIEEILEILSVNLLGAVPEDENVAFAANNGTPCVFDERSKAGQAYKNIARRLNGEEVALVDLKGKKNVFARILDAILNK